MKPSFVASWSARPAGDFRVSSESSSDHDKTKLADATKKLLKNWNAGLQTLAPAIKHPDAPTPLVPYGDTWAAGDRLPIPEMDMPAGLPAWMHEQDGWADREGTD